MNPERLKQARLVTGMTLDQVAEKLASVGQRITKAGLSKYERGKSMPKPLFLSRLAEVLGVKTDYFLSEPEISIDWCGFRKKSGLTKSVEDRVKAQAGHHVERWMCLRDMLYPGEKPTFAYSTKKLEQDAEAASLELRKRWGLGDTAPIESVIQSVEDHGAIVFLTGELDEKFDGLSGMVNGHIPLVIVARKAPCDRFRFNVAHELGHVVLELGDSKEENQTAHRFASSFLVPRESLLRDLGRHRANIPSAELAILKRKYGISMSALLRRAYDLNIITMSVYERYMRIFGKKGWRRQEPVDVSDIFPETPTRLRLMTMRALTEGMISEDRANEMVPNISEHIEKTDQQKVRRYLTPVELMRLPTAERERILAQAAEEAEKEYQKDSSLTDFEAFAEEEILDDY